MVQGHSHRLVLLAVELLDEAQGLSEGSQVLCEDSWVCVRLAELGHVVQELALDASIEISDDIDELDALGGSGKGSDSERFHFILVVCLFDF